MVVTVVCGMQNERQQQQHQTAMEKRKKAQEKWESKGRGRGRGRNAAGRGQGGRNSDRSSFIASTGCISSICKYITVKSLWGVQLETTVLCIPFTV